MRSGSLIRLIFIGFVLGAAVSCDTADNVEVPNYFVKYFGEAGDQEGVDLVVNSDGTILLFGNTTLPGETNSKLYLVKVDADGKLLWEKGPFGGVLKNQARDIEVTSDGRIVLVATSEKAAGDNDVLLMTTDQNGVELKRVMYGLDGNEDAVSVTQISDGFIVTGSTTQTNRKGNPPVGVTDPMDVFNFRFFDDLSLYPNTWNETLGSNDFDAGTKIIEASPGQFYFFGYSNQIPPRPDHSTRNYNYWIFPISNSGASNGVQTFIGDPGVDERLTSVTMSPVQSGEGYLLTGMRRDASGNNSVYVGKLRKDINYQNGQDEIIQFPAVPLSGDFELGQLSTNRTAAYSSILSGFVIVSNENSSGNENLYLTKITNTGRGAWSQPKGFVFGGGNADTIGSVAELPDGSILIVGTFSVGDDNQKKMTLIKVNKDGKFSN